MKPHLSWFFASAVLLAGCGDDSSQAADAAVGQDAAAEASALDAAPSEDASTTVDASPTLDAEVATDASSSADAAFGSGAVCGVGMGLSDCARGEFCAFAEGEFCGAADAPGFCRTIADGLAKRGCDDTLQAVCACNGVTYNSECEAWANGSSVYVAGACDI